MRKALLILTTILSSWYIFAQDKPLSAYTPRIEGTIRGKYEYFTVEDEHRFQVRNARFSVRGAISPISFYKAEIDLSDEGKTKMLDAWVKLMPQKNWSITLGQQKVPFSTDNLRSPHQLYFANRSFIGKQLTNLRDVGVSANLINNQSVPFDLTVGIYNGLGLYTQDKSMKLSELSYAARVIILPENSLKFSLNANTIMPGNIRMTFYNAGMMYDLGKFHIEGEFLYKTYSENTLLNADQTTGFFVLSAYDFKTPKLKNIEKITPVIRFDQMTKNLKYDISGSSSIGTKTDEARGRISTGVNISLAKPFTNEIRVDYEHYFRENGTHAESKFVVEYMIKF